MLNKSQQVGFVVGIDLCTARHLGECRERHLLHTADGMGQGVVTHCDSPVSLRPTWSWDTSYPQQKCSSGSFAAKNISPPTALLEGVETTTFPSPRRLWTCPGQGDVLPYKYRGQWWSAAQWWFLSTANGTAAQHSGNSAQTRRWEWSPINHKQKPKSGCRNKSKFLRAALKPRARLEPGGVGCSPILSPGLPLLSWSAELSHFEWFCCIFPFATGCRRARQERKPGPWEEREKGKCFRSLLGNKS